MGRFCSGRDRSREFSFKHDNIEVLLRYPHNQVDIPKRNLEPRDVHLGNISVLVVFEAMQG